MNLENKNILLISPESWDHIFVSKHHYATYLAKKGNKVFFLNPPSKNLSCLKTEIENVFSVHYQGFISGLRFFPMFIQKFIVKKKIEALQKLCKAKFDIVWSFDNSVFYDFSAFPKSVFCISHIVDWNQDFEFSIASRTAHLCLASSKFITEKQRLFNPNSHNIGHGFNKAAHEIKPLVLKGKSKINCGYAGNLDINYLDWDLVETLVQRFHNVDFHFAGKWDLKDQFSELVKRDNFYYYGKLPSDILAAFYVSMDLLLIVYQYEKHPEQLANPHKMMEYLASGKMILATWSEEYTELNSNLIQMEKDTTQFAIKMGSILEQLANKNQLDLQQKRIEYTNKKSYEEKINEIENLINSNSI